MSIRIAIADDHPLIAEGIGKILARYTHISIGAHYPSGKALLEGLKEEQPDVLLLDIQFPDISGHALVRAIGPLYPGLKILAITSQDDPFEVQDMLQNGCMGYVHKTVSAAVLVHAIETLYRGERFLEATIKERIWETMITPRQEKTIEISAKEQEILELVCDGFSNADIGEKLFMSSRTVEKYKLGLYQKFGVNNAVRLAKIALRYKLIK